VASSITPIVIFVLSLGTALLCLCFLLFVLKKKQKREGNRFCIIQPLSINRYMSSNYAINGLFSLKSYVSESQAISCRVYLVSCKCLYILMKTQYTSKEGNHV
jgi:hypothetical protein